VGFKENLLKKIAVDRLADQVIASIGPAGTEKKTDRSAMRRLVEMGPHAFQKERDLDLFLLDLGDQEKKILVLDNELPLYRTTVEDVGLRKSPTLKEMISIRNAIKILSDKDVKISTREETVNRVRNAWIAGLDLSFTASDLEEIEKEGIASLDRGYSEGVTETLTLFAELLGYTGASKPLDIPHCHIIGRPVTRPSGEHAMGPVVIYSLVHNRLHLLTEPVGIYEKAAIERMHHVASGKEKGDKEGPDVFAFLKDEILQKKQPGAAGNTSEG